MKRSVFLRCVSLFCVLCLLCVPVGATGDWESEMDGTAISGDLDSNGQVDNQDVEYLLWHTLFPEDYALNQSGNFDGIGSVDNQDVEYLLWFTLFPEDYPITQSADYTDDGKFFLKTFSISSARNF